MASPSDAGLRAERTGLAWSRTSLGVATNAALLAIRELGHAQLGLALVLASLALVLAVATAIYGRHRTRALRHAPLPAPPAPSRAVLELGSGVVLLGILSGIVVIL